MSDAPPNRIVFVKHFICTSKYSLMSGRPTTRKNWATTRKRTVVRGMLVPGCQVRELIVILGHIQVYIYCYDMVESRG